MQIIRKTEAYCLNACNYGYSYKDTMDLMFNEVVLEESELFDYLQKVYTRLLSDFKLSDFYTSDEIAEKEGLFI